MCSFMQLRNCINECMLWFLECLSYFVADDLILLFVAFVLLLGLVDTFFYCLWIFLVVCAYMIGYWVGTLVLVLCGHEWILRYWSWFDPSSTSILAHVKMIETCVESVFATVCVQSVIAGCILLFWWGRLGRVALHQVTWSKKLNNKLKVIILLLSESESFTIPFYGNPLNSACGCIQMGVTAAVATENVCMSSRWKDELVFYGICKQPLPRFVSLLPLKPNRSPICPACPESF
jgi:hypothetical protein